MDYNTCSSFDFARAHKRLKKKYKKYLTDYADSDEVVLQSTDKYKAKNRKLYKMTLMPKFKKTMLRMERAKIKAQMDKNQYEEERLEGKILLVKQKYFQKIFGKERGGK
jgi:lysyl-tRNA synthetase class I